MEAFEKLLGFINSYPLYAKIAVVAFAFGIALILLFSPRSSEKAKEPKSASGALKLEIGEVRLFPVDPHMDIRVLAYVNGNQFVHPSVGGVEWMRTGPDMSHKIVPLPNSAALSIRFEIEVRQGEKLVGMRPLQVRDAERYVSQMSVDIDLGSLPHDGTYSLYAVNEIGSRSPTIGAEIDYKVFRD